MDKPDYVGLQSERLDFAELHKEKLAVIFENIDVLSAMKESDTVLPPRFFGRITDDVIRDYNGKMGILNKNTRFVIRELRKDFRRLRRTQRRRHRRRLRRFPVRHGRFPVKQD